MLDPSKMNPIERSIYDNTMNKLMNTTAAPTTGTITEVDSENWVATVDMIDPFSGDIITQDNVSLPRQANGTKGTAPKAGDKVAINFAGGSIYAPCIVTIFKSEEDSSETKSSFSAEISKFFGIF